MIHVAGEDHRVGCVRFVAEQDGPAERDLKAQLVQCLRRCSIRRAYLVRVEYLGGDASVALCLVGNARRRSEILACSNDVFAGLFHTSQSLDTIFLSRIQESDLRRVCRPFYRSDLVSTLRGILRV